VKEQLIQVVLKQLVRIQIERSKVIILLRTKTLILAQMLAGQVSLFCPLGHQMANLLYKRNMVVTVNKVYHSNHNLLVKRRINLLNIPMPKSFKGPPSMQISKSLV